MVLEELLEALKELNYEHQLFYKRVEELQTLLDKEPTKAMEDLLLFLRERGSSIIVERKKQPFQPF